ncbi:ph-response sensor protein [Ascosphaera pollenicola]|nr:ph-response sensor protein [Ascosphaera pollenicola]
MSRDFRKRDVLKDYLPPQASKAQGSALRRVNLYDAIAGRASVEGFRGLKNPFDLVNTNNPLARSTTSIPPEDVLFRRLNAPTRYMEDDFYFAHEKLPSDVVLPDSDLLKATHAYVSDFYASTVPSEEQISLHSMDHTALIAFGILLEEAALTMLGETGDMTLIEGVEEESDQEVPGPVEAGSVVDESRPRSRASPRGRKRVQSPTFNGWKQDEELAPKSLPPVAKQRLVLNYLRNSRTCHTLKDLEKTLPSAASINGMQVKDYINALHDENCIHVEKIGSGNWYWAWANEEKNELVKVKNTLVAEKARIDASIQECEANRVALAAELGVDIGPEEEAERKDLFIQRAALEAEITALKTEEQGRLDGNIGGGIGQKEDNIRRWKAETEMWTDNIYILEEYLNKLAGGDREVMDSVKRECYGDDFIEDEGLRELTF